MVYIFHIDLNDYEIRKILPIHKIIKNSQNHVITKLLKTDHILLVNHIIFFSINPFSTNFPLL